MQVNELPKIDMKKSETGCCPVFDSSPWDEKEYEFKDKPFVRFTTRSFLHIPLNMGSQMKKVYEAAEKAGASTYEFALLSNDLSAWKAEHYYAVTKEVPGVDNENLTGKYLTKVFEGPYSGVRKWHGQLKEYAISKGKDPKKLFFYYTTCPKCAKHYKKNYVVGFAQV